ncbi:palmdelphin-like [Xyrichtys novacula]|uniref:Palmdelphin n=1 Tax=Xyrichtys novacula TaxID=13765 RepID=A0AAV1HMA3_XYRNO|nr:palmdelphin-like [Xyrichtys novacula]
MEESDLLKERLQAITEKHRIQEEIRQKKVELDQEKLKLQHLKKKSLREQWLLQGATSHNATDPPQQQQSSVSEQRETRALQLKIHRIEMDIMSLEREESIVSTNERFILSRLKAVEKSAEDIIKEAQDSFVQEPVQVSTAPPEVPECPTPAASKHSEPNSQRKTLFAMEINVTRNLLTGESTVVSTASVPTEELHQHNGLKVFDDGRKCVYALSPQQGSHDPSHVSELSANEVEQLLRRATVHRQSKSQNNRQNHSRGEELCFYNCNDNKDVREGYDLLNLAGDHGDHLLGNNGMEKDFSRQRKQSAEHRYSQQENHYRGQEERNNHNNLRDGCCHGNNKSLGQHHGNHKDVHYSSYEVRHCHSVHENQPPSCYTNGIIRRNSRATADRANRCPPPRSHDQEVVSAYQPQLCYTPANHIPLTDYINVEEDDLYCMSQTFNHKGDQPSSLYRGSALSDRVPSPLYADNAPYTILNTVDTTEPITAIFMGFQTAQDDIGPGQEFEGSLKAELVIIEDSDEDRGEDCRNRKEKHSGSVSHHAGSSTNGNMGPMQKPMEPGIRKIQKKHRHCCTVC